MDWLTSGATSLEDIVFALTERGCSNLTYSISLATCSERPIAGGGLCDVYQGELNHGTKVAIKALRIYDKPGQTDAKQKMLKRAAREIDHWSRLKNRNILPLMGLAVFRGYISTVSEWMEHGDLRSYVEGHPEVDRISLCSDVCAGLCYLHEKGMVHGDLKAANVMVSPSGVAMLAGFGNSQLKDLVVRPTNTATHGRSIRWMAPELLQKDHCLDVSKEADVYAFGMTVLETLTGREPYEGFTEESLIVMITSKYHPPACPTTISSAELWDLLTQCWAKELSERPTIEDVGRWLQTLSTPVGDTRAEGHPTSESPRPFGLLPAWMHGERVHSGKGILQRPLKTKVATTGGASERSVSGQATIQDSEQNAALGISNLNKGLWLQLDDAKVIPHKESSVDKTINEQGQTRTCTVVRPSTPTNEGRATAHQNIFGRPNAGYKLQQRFDAREKNAHDSPYTRDCQYQPYPPVRPNYSQQPPLPVQRSGAQYPLPPLPPICGSQSPQAPPQRPQSKVDGDYHPMIKTARPLPHKASDPAVQSPTQHGRTPAQVYHVHQRRSPAARPPALPAVEMASNPSLPDANSSVPRRPIESAHTVTIGVGANGGPLGRRGHTYTDLVGNIPVTDRMPSMSASASSTRPPMPTQGPERSLRSRPLVYPALLSRVASAFRQRISLGERTKGGLTYSVAFDGQEAVDLIAYIIMTLDRNLALILGRALDAQKFFHDVTYGHRLRDSSVDIYQFSTREEETTAELPSGVFTLLTECYSPTCSRNQLCYCLACPRRLEQITRQQSYRPQVTNSVALSPAASLSGTTIAGGSIALSSKLKGNSSKESLIDHGLKEPGQLWVHSVPQEVVDSVSDQEKKRQEAINEVIYTERDFVRDLEYLRDRWMEPLRTEEVIPPERRIDFVQQVFWNIEDILDVNTRLRDLLTKRQNAYPVVETIGDIFSELVPHFQPFVQYGEHQLYGKYEFEKEKSTNPAFAAFVETVERLPESRGLGLNEYLTEPAMRLARYRLLLEVVLEHTSEDNPDRAAIPEAVGVVRKTLSKLNEESGKAENRFNLLQLSQRLAFQPAEEVDLKLQDKQRRLSYQGTLKYRRGVRNQNVDLQVFLLDHALLMTKSKMTQQREQLVVFKRPIPLELLDVSTPEEEAAHRSKSAATGYQFTITHLGKKGYSLALCAPTMIARRKWVDHITTQRDMASERTRVFEVFSLSEDVFVGQTKVNCAVPYDHGQRIAYGTNAGVYFQSFRDNHSQKPAKVIHLVDVQQIDVLEEYKLLIVLSERSVLASPLDIHLWDPIKRMKRISSRASFFKVGNCLGRVLLCVVRVDPATRSSTIKILEPIDLSIREKDKPPFKKLLQGGNDTFKVYKEFYMPTESHSIHFLKTKLCIACTEGFEIVDLETLDTQALLDPADASFNLLQKRDAKFAFYVDKTGRRSKQDLVIYWGGSPTAFALHYPYVIVFEPAFIEIRHVNDGSLAQVIRGNNPRLLFTDIQLPVINSMHTMNPSLSSTSSIGSGSVNRLAPQMAAYGHPHHTQRRAHERNEILIVVDDEVMEVLPAAPVTEV